MTPDKCAVAACTSSVVCTGYSPATSDTVRVAVCSNHDVVIDREEGERKTPKKYSLDDMEVDRYVNHGGSLTTQKEWECHPTVVGVALSGPKVSDQLSSLGR